MILAKKLKNIFINFGNFELILIDLAIFAKFNNLVLFHIYIICVC